MGMFDDFKFNLNLVKDLVDEDQFTILQTRDKKYFYGQTKDLDCAMSFYEIYRKRLYQHNSNAFDDMFESVNFEPKDRLETEKEFVKTTNYINVYDYIENKEGSHYFNFRLHFVDGKLNSIILNKYEFTSVEEIDKNLKELETKLKNRNNGFKNKIKQKLANAAYGVYRFFSY